MARSRDAATKSGPLSEVLASEMVNDLGGGSLRATWLPPHHRAAWIHFSDEDPRKGYVKGLIEIGAAGNESDVSHYSIFWASNHSTMDLIVALPKGIYQPLALGSHSVALRHELGPSAIPEHANQLAATQPSIDKKILLDLFR